MTTETKKEIIKALAYGLDAATVADCNGVTQAEVEAVAAGQYLSGTQTIAKKWTELDEKMEAEFR